MKISRPKLVLIFVGLAVLLMVVALALALIRRLPSWPPTRLADGSTVRIVSVDVSREHFQPQASVFERAVAALPAKLRRFVPTPPASASYSASAATLGVWLEWDRLPQAVVTNATGGSSSFLLCLGDGRQFLIHSLQEAEFKLPDGRYVEGHFFPAPPPTIPVVKARLYLRPQWGGDTPEADRFLTEWTLEPEAKPPRVPLTAQPLPQTRLLEDLEVTLKSVVLDADGRGSSETVAAAPHAESSWSDARFELRQNGQPATQWQVERISVLTDASDIQYGSSTWNNGHDYIRWRWPLWPDQPWKLAIEFTRTNGFATNELFTVTGLLPNTGLTNVATLGTGQIQLVELKRSRWNAEEWRLEVKFAPAKSPARLTVVSARDSKGEVLTGSRSSWGDNSTEFHLQKYSTNSGPVDVTLALQLGRVAEFMVEPSLLNTNQTILKNH